MNTITVNKKPNNFIVVGHKGSFGNHVRLLLLLSDQFDFTSNKSYSCANTKLEFIIKQVYNQERTWNNWLWLEGQWRRELEKLVPFAHNIRSKSQMKRVILLSDPETAYRSYIKFSSNLDVATKETFLSYCILYNENVATLSNNRDIVTTSSELFQEELDQDWYSSLVSKLNLTNEYEHANKLHRHWYQLHKKAERDMLADLTQLFLDK